MDFKVLITDNAVSDLREIVSFVAQDDSAAAMRLGEKLIQCALSLRTMPARFPIHDRKRGIRKMTAAPISSSILTMKQLRPCTFSIFGMDRDVCHSFSRILSRPHPGLAPFIQANRENDDDADDNFLHVVRPI